VRLKFDEVARKGVSGLLEEALKACKKEEIEHHTGHTLAGLKRMAIVPPHVKQTLVVLAKARRSTEWG
jgi:hypothetical protein